MPQIPDEVRQQVIDWPADAPKGSVAAFCAKHGVSRAWFYKTRRLAAEQGQDAMVKASTRPKTSPARLSELTRMLALAERARLKADGKDYGPESVRYALWAKGVDPVPSRSSLVRIFDRAGVVDRNRKKPPKRSFKRFAASFPNQRWQSDGFVETLADGTEVIIIEIIDDATRYCLGITVAAQETAEAVVRVFRDAISTHGRPVLVHTDNGTAFNTTRWGGRTQLVALLEDLGIRSMTGRPGTPRSQGKVERSHQNIRRFVAAHRHRCHSAEDLQQLLTTEYQHWYNHHRAHQSLGRNTTPADLYETLPKVVPPSAPAAVLPGASAGDQRIGLATRTGTHRGFIRYSGKKINLGQAFAGKTVHLVEHPDRLEFFDADGTSLAALSWPTENQYPSVAKLMPRRLRPSVH